MAYTVKAVSDLAGVTVRTLHHYDEIGLLKPESVSASGYRLYGDAELERLQQILFLRELGFSLEDIKEILDSPGFDRKQALQTHRRLLVERRDRVQAMIRSVDRTLDAMERGMTMDKKAMFEGFDDSKIRAHMEQYKEEARGMYGKEMVDESYRPVSKYTKQDWAPIKAEEAEITATVAGQMDKGPADPVVQEKMAQKFRMIRDIPRAWPSLRGR